MEKKLCQKDARLLFVVCWFAYCCSYLGRQNYSAAMNELVNSFVTKQEAGWVNTGFFVCYAMGQLLNGLLVEKRSPYRIGLIGIAGAGVLNLLFPYARSFSAMLVLRSLTGCCMSMIWPALLRCMVCYMQRADVVWSSVQIASSTAIGSIVAYLLSSALLHVSGWQSVFVVPGLLLVACAMLWALCIPAVVSRADQIDQTSPVTSKPKDAPSLSFGRLLLLPTMLIALIPTIFHGAIKDGVTAWIPTYMCEVFGCTTAFAVLVTTLLPIINLFGAYAAKWIYRHCQEHVFRASAIFFAFSVLLLILLYRFAQHSLPFTLICFALITSSMLAVNVLLINLLPLQFDCYHRASTVSGTLNAVAYGGSAATSGLIGVITQYGGWNSAMLSWIVMMIIAFLFCLLGGYVRQNDV